MTVPKVACTTVKRTLHAFEGLTLANSVDEHAQGMELSLDAYDAEQVVEMLTAGDWLRFAFVRNPYERLVSAWKSKIVSHADPYYAKLRHHIRRHYAYRPEDGSAPQIAFRGFVDFILASADGPAGKDGHWDLQTSILCHGLIDYHVIGRFERFTTDFSAILRRLGAPPPVMALATEVTNATAPMPLPTLFDQDLADRVFHHYEADFDAFSYPRDSWMHRAQPEQLQERAAAPSEVGPCQWQTAVNASGVQVDARKGRNAPWSPPWGPVTWDRCEAEAQEW